MSSYPFLPLKIPKNTIKNNALATTIDGPDGVSNASDPASPNPTATTPKIPAYTAIASGDRATCRAVAAGIISNELISKIPTIRMETATTTAIKNINNSCIQNVRIPSARAKSSLTLISKNARQFHANNAKTNAPPP